ncbi:MAG: PAS domain S-box protein [Oscillatoria princeps RMCB-10]|jgi:twitching motility protein PilJ|nr:PAS domain S-box protein [Oscillatoria princeps RMCB-10]
MVAANLQALAYTFSLNSTQLEGLDRGAYLSVALCYLGLALALTSSWLNRKEKEKKSPVSTAGGRARLLAFAFFLTGAVSNICHAPGCKDAPEALYLWQTTGDVLHAISALALLWFGRQWWGQPQGAAPPLAGERQYLQLMQLAINNIPQTIFWKDRNSVYQGCNQAFAKQAGVATPADIVGKTDSDLAWKHSEAEFFREVDRRLMESDTPQYHIIEPLQNADGKETWVETNKIPLHDATGTVTGILGTYEEITERKRAEAERTRLWQVVESSLNEIYLFDAQTLRFQYANTGALRNLGYSLEVMRAMTLVDIQPETDYHEFRQRIAPLLRREREKLVFETAHQRADGSLYPVEVHLQLIERDGESVFLAIIGDTSERKRTEDALRERSEQLRLFVDHTPAAVAMFDRQMRYLAASRRWLSDLNLGDQDIIGKSHYEIFPEIPNSWKEIHRKCLAGAVEKCEEDPFLRADGSTDWVKWEIHPWRTAKGEIGGIIIASEAITKRKQAEEALRQSEERFRLLVESVKDYAILLLDTTGNVISWNAGAEKIKGYRASEILGKHFSRFYTPADISAGKPERELLQAAQEGRFEEEGVRVRSDGSEFWANVIVNALRDESGQLRGFSKVTRDITDRKQAQEALKQARDQLEKRVGERTTELSRSNALLKQEIEERTSVGAALRESRERLQAILDNSPAVIYLKDTAGRYILVNRQFETVCQMTPEQILGKTDSDLFPEQIAGALRASDRQVLAGRTPLKLEEVIPQNDGAHTYISIKFSLCDDSGVPYAICGISTDITERKQAEEKLRLVTQAVESAGDAIAILNPTGTEIYYHNRAFSDLLEHTGGDSFAARSRRSNPVWLPLADKNAGSEILETVMAGNSWSGEVGIRSRSGRTVPAFLRADGIKDDTGSMVGLIAVFTDITERKQVEEKLEKLAAERKAEADALNQQVLKLLSEIQGAAKGDLTVRAEVPSGVLGAVADSFNFLTGSLRRAVTGIVELAAQVTAATSSAIGNTEELVGLARSQAQQIEATLQQIELLVNSIKEVSDVSGRAEKVAQQASQTAAAGGVAVDRAVEGIGELRQTISETSKMMKRLSESSQQIGKIVTSISQIAAQTNLLALNATIEAARAGEQGLGFAVVADEVRKLAERSADATEEIGEIVGTIQEEIRRVTGRMDAGTQEAVAGTKLAAEAKTHLIAIIEVSQEMNSLVQNITRAAQKQTVSAQEIASSMRQVSAISATTAHKAERVTSSLNGLAVAVNQLQSSVANFRS